MITLKNDRLEFRFPEVHRDARCTIEFQRTLRIPDDDRDYPLPPGLGRFPLRHIDDFARRLPEQWGRRGGVIAPMHQAEALWIAFGGHSEYPFAVKIATGKICAISGNPWVDHLNKDPQDFVVLPEQPWLDGYCVEKGVIRQFVAMPLGKGYTAEEQLTGAAQHGGLQIVVYPMKRKRYKQLMARYSRRDHRPDVLYCASPEPMGLAPGGRMRQEVYDDPYGLDAWDRKHSRRCFVTIANSTQWMAITGERPPTLPPSARHYTEAGLPWFEWYGGDAVAVDGAKKLEKLASVAQLGKKKGEQPLLENESVEVTRVVGLSAEGITLDREFTSDEILRS